MIILPFIERRDVPELMDAAGLDAGVHRRALAGLERINRFSRTAQSMVRPIVAMARREGVGHMTVLDIACGGGGVPVQMARLAKRAGLDLTLVLSDRSPTALVEAAARAKNAGIAATCVESEAPHKLPEGRYDVVTSSLFLHHLWGRGVVETLAGMRLRARRMIVVSDLRRSRAGYALAWTACRILSRSRIVHHDGPASVRAAWTIREMGEMARYAGLEDGGDLWIRSCWPCRMLLSWESGAESRGEGSGENLKESSGGNGEARRG